MDAALSLAQQRLAAAAVQQPPLSLVVLYAGVEHFDRFLEAEARLQETHFEVVATVGSPDGSCSILVEDMSAADLVQWLYLVTEDIPISGNGFDASFVGPVFPNAHPWLGYLLTLGGASELSVPLGHPVFVSWEAIYDRSFCETTPGLPAEWYGQPPQFWMTTIPDVIGKSVAACERLGEVTNETSLTGVNAVEHEAENEPCDTGWKNTEPDESSPFKHGPVTGYAKDLAKACGLKKAEQLKNTSGRSCWVMKLNRTTFRAWFRTRQRFVDVNAKHLQITSNTSK